MIIMKFGGTSVGTAERLRTACRLVQERRKDHPCVVVSAHNSPQCRMTDTLIACARQALAGKPDPTPVINAQLSICRDLGVDSKLVESLLDEFGRLLTGIAMIRELSPRTLDLVMSFGERMSCRVFHDVLHREFGVSSACVDSYDLGLLTDGNFGSAQPDKSSYPDIVRNVDKLKVEAVVTTGFLGKSREGHITTLGRGGSDYSATIFGAALGAKEVQIWTDVCGVMTADPSVVPTARSIPVMSFMEASELAWYGAKVLHPATMIPAMDHNIPLRVLNTTQPEHPGTLILPHSPRNSDPVKSIAYKEHINLVTITSSRMLGTHGFMAKVFEIFGRHRIDIHMIATSEITISLTIPKGDNLYAAADDLKAFADVQVEHNKAIICVVGENMAGTPGIARRVCGAVADANVNIRMISQGARELNIALLIDDTDVQLAVQSLHREFFEKS